MACAASARVRLWKRTPRTSTVSGAAGRSGGGAGTVEDFIKGPEGDVGDVALADEGAAAVAEVLPERGVGQEAGGRFSQRIRIGGDQEVLAGYDVEAFGALQRREDGQAAREGVEHFH